MCSALIFNRLAMSKKFLLIRKIHIMCAFSKKVSFFCIACSAEIFILPNTHSVVQQTLKKDSPPTFFRYLQMLLPLTFAGGGVLYICSTPPYCKFSVGKVDNVILRAICSALGDKSYSLSSFERRLSKTTILDPSDLPDSSDQSCLRSPCANTRAQSLLSVK